MKISEQKRNKISEQILAFLYSISPKLIFTAHLAMEIARDEEYTKKLLLELKSKKLVVQITKNPQGKQYIQRSRWKLSDEAFKFFKDRNKFNTQVY
ncbi:MAG: hypothetical protein KJ566_01535 [Nanoarchaeota archaeon]|nr:hypothetical protein [Nanoarchaeota archaeon]